MKAKPIAIINGEYVQVEPKSATHVKIHLPGLTGELLLPIMIGGTRQGTGNWTWNGDTEKPTLKPSVLVQIGHFAPGFKTEDSCWCKYFREHPEEKPVFSCFRCHTWIGDGKATFLPDSTHEFTGKCLELLDVK